MKVVFLTRRYWPSVGGVERHVQFLSQALLQQLPSIELQIITEQHDPSLPEKEIHQGLEILRLPLQPDTNNPDIKKSVWEWMRQHKMLLQNADIIHIHDVFFWLQPFLLSLRKPRIYTTFHGYEPPGPPTWRQRLMHQLAELQSEGNICVGSFHQKWYGVEPTVESYGAVEEAFANIPVLSKTKSTSVRSSQRKYLFIGRLEEDTGIWAYLEAMSALKERNELNFRLDVVGEGALNTQLQEFVKQTDLPVSFLGVQQATPQLYRSYDAACVSGYLSMLEALASGLPVVATYMTLLKKDYLLLSPFADWVSVAAPGAALATALQAPVPLQPKAQAWAQRQMWAQLAAQYLRLWQVGKP